MVVIAEEWQMEFSRAGSGVGRDGEVRSLNIHPHDSFERGKGRQSLGCCFLMGAETDGRDRDWTARVQARMDQEKRAEREREVMGEPSGSSSAAAGEGTSSSSLGGARGV